ncbi:PDZ domain-containing protein [bacterium]|nr:PDZ domain-containing protein [bacterium]
MLPGRMSRQVIHRIRLQWLSISLCAVVVCASSTPLLAQPMEDNSALAEQGVKQLQAMEAALQQAIDRTRPSVVSIFLQDSAPNGLDPQFAPGMARPYPSTPQPASFGSGVILRKEGLIATCYHVVRSAARSANGLGIRVVLHDGTSFAATVYAADPRSDLAVLKLVSANPLELTPINIGDGGKLFPGQFVLALGNPFGVAEVDGSISASWGIISNMRRRPAPPAPSEQSESMVFQGRTLVQTDARLNMGSSGSALINIQGELVGVGMALSAAIGIEAPGGFAQPIDAATKRILDTLAEGREVEYGFIGISFDSTRVPIGGGQVGNGVVVARIALPSTRMAGLLPGDVISSVNDHPIKDVHDLIFTVGSLPAGTKLRTKVVRKGAEQELTLTLGKFPLREEPIVTNKRPLFNGLRVDHLSTLVDKGNVGWGDENGGLPPYGVAVREVIPGSPAAEKGIQPKQIILAVNGEKILDPDQFDQLVAAATGPIKLTFTGDVEQVFGSGDEKKSDR